MTWQEFDDSFGGTGAIRLGSWSLNPAPADMIECRATIAYADRIMSMSATATGPVGAMTSILHEMGAPVQVVSVHQRQTDDGITAFMLCEHNHRQCWVYGDGATADEANVNALVAGANRLLEPDA
ncbi:hypothetical protein GYA93_06200 [Gordonia desulfuricans]|uniref:2-isopropylmalate synthase n=1 Tax=Gordonia desulfuricans TaxID=89051 RepID=A0A7K3LLP8_9ACTN|nr:MULTISPECIES: hypothetical protein [Gordonia]KOY50003.1 hypothetical protein ISGA_06505 [Gordonia sp. NB41Y]NDK89175.1 hypothetical protein [Gordonia desulfuricans]WLP88979.1 hypothetical protein Q9K23_15360 [Gordonia sp. NB41Y]